LTTVGIECLSGYYAGEKAERKHFVSFIKDFMPAYAVFADDIYACVRNGLTHDYVIKENPTNRHTFLFQRDHGEPHLSPTPKNPNAIYLNRTDYANDFLEAQRLYFEKVDNTQTLWDTAMRRVKSQKGFLTVFPPDELVVRPTIGSGQVPAQSASAMGSLTTGTSSKPPDVP
jgi:hypothetical protein